MEGIDSLLRGWSDGGFAGTGRRCGERFEWEEREGDYWRKGGMCT